MGTFVRFVHPDDMSTPESDADLVARARRRERAAFEALMRRHNTTLYRVVRGVLRDEAEVEDAMQEAWVHALTHLEQLEDGSSFAPWVRKIASHEALGRVRRRQHSPFMEVELDTPEPTSLMASPEHESARAQFKDALEQAVDELPDSFRQVFMLRSVEGCSVAETAQLLGVHEETVKTRLFRARARLQSTLSAWADHGFSSTFSFQAPRCDALSIAVLEKLGLVP